MTSNPRHLKTDKSLLGVDPLKIVSFENFQTTNLPNELRHLVEEAAWFTGGGRGNRRKATDEQSSRVKKRKINYTNQLGQSE